MTVRRSLAPLVSLCLAAAFSLPLIAQQRVQAVGIGGHALQNPNAKAAQDGEAEDAALGNLLLPESANLNRILDRASDFFARDQWEDGIEVLQDLLEGKALDAGPHRLDDPAYSVYSENQRLYVPFTRFCQRLLCTLPPEGLEVYRLRIDARAKVALESARQSLEVEPLARAVELYFATSHGPELVLLLADLVTYRGELERAVHLRARLLADYPDLPAALRRTTLLRQLHAFALLGERARMEQIHGQLLAQDPKGSARIRGELVPFERLPEHPAFRVRERDERRDQLDAEMPLGSLQLLPLWEFECNDEDPYGVRHQQKNQRNVFFAGNQGGIEVPEPKSFRPGTQLLPGVEVPGPAGQARSALAFKDYDRLVLLDIVSGKLLRDEQIGNSRSKSLSGNNSLQVRMAATDYGTFEVAQDGDRLYLTIENSVSTGSNTHPFRNRLACYELSTGRPLWITDPNPHDGERLFFQTPPVRYRDRLYAPVRKGRAFCIAALEADTGKVVEVVSLHSGGTSLVRVPVQRPLIVGDQLIHATNAGVVAACRLPDLEVHWRRIYETSTPHEAEPATQRIQMRGFGYRIQERALKQWKPVRPLAHRGRIVLAPIDSDALLCLSAATGEVEWILPRLERGYRNVEFEELVGVHEDRLFLAGSELQAVDLVTGKRLWEEPLSPWFQRREGRGVVHGGRIYLPAQGEVHAFDAQSGQHLGRFTLGPIVTGESAPEDPVNLAVHGGVLFAATDDRVRAYAVPEDLVVHADTELERVRRLVAVHRVVGAIDELRHLLVQRVLEGDVLTRARELYVRLCGELADSELDASGAERAFAVLNGCEETLRKAGLDADPRLLLYRIEISERLGRDRDVLDLRERLLSTPIEEAR